MNLRQIQRTLADVLAKCEEIHVQLPVDPFDSMLSAGEALRHSRVGNKFHPDDAVDELKQRYGLEPKWQQMEDAADAKRRRQGEHKRYRLRRGDESPNQESQSTAQQQASAGGGMHSDTDSTGAAKSSDSTSHVSKKPRTSPSAAVSHGSSRIDRIIENNPAKNPENEELAEEFVELGGYELTHGEKQKGISRMAVAKQIRLAEKPITSGAEAQKLPHVGPSAAAKIDEVLHRGKMKVLEEYEKEGKQAAAQGNEVTAKPAKVDGDPKHHGQKDEAAVATQNVEGDSDAEHEEEDAEDEDNGYGDDDDDDEEEEEEEADDQKDADWQNDEEVESAEDD